MEYCASGIPSMEDIVERASSEFGYTASELHPSVLRMARAEESILSLLNRAKTAETKAVILEVLYPRNMSSARTKTSWTSRTDTVHSILRSPEGIQLRIWTNENKTVVGCIFLTFEPNGPLLLPPVFKETFWEMQHEFGSIQKFKMPHPGMRGSIQVTSPFSTLKHYVPDRPKTTSLILVSTRREPPSS